jgi:hypothetical protein
VGECYWRDAGGKNNKRGFHWNIPVVGDLETRRHVRQAGSVCDQTCLARGTLEPVSDEAGPLFIRRCVGERHMRPASNISRSATLRREPAGRHKGRTQFGGQIRHLCGKSAFLNKNAASNAWAERWRSARFPTAATKVFMSENGEN